MQFDFCRKTIADIEWITVEEIRTYDEVEFSQRKISIRTKEGVFEIVLQTDTPQNLEFRDPPDPNAWLTPKVYKGKTMHEEEMDE